jgi:hypothetical protein
MSIVDLMHERKKDMGELPIRLSGEQREVVWGIVADG